MKTIITAAGLIACGILSAQTPAQEREENIGRATTEGVEVFASLSITDRFNLRADIVPDKVTRVRFVPDKTGTFTFLCDIFCGTKHEEMNGKIKVTSEIGKGTTFSVFFPNEKRCWAIEPR